MGSPFGEITNKEPPDGAVFLCPRGIGAEPHSKMRGTRSGTAQAVLGSPSPYPIKIYIGGRSPHKKCSAESRSTFLFVLFPDV